MDASRIKTKSMNQTRPIRQPPKVNIINPFQRLILRTEIR